MTLPGTIDLEPAIALVVGSCSKDSDKERRSATTAGLGIEIPLSAQFQRSSGPRHQRSRSPPGISDPTMAQNFFPRTILKWLGEEKIEMALIDPGKPWQNGTNESLNGKFRDEWLSMECFRNRVDAKIVTESWRRHYNEVRPHSSLGQLTPAEFQTALSTTSAERAIF